VNTPKAGNCINIYQIVNDNGKINYIKIRKKGEKLMKAIVVYYSLTGKTKSVAEGFAKEMDCEIKQIQEVRKRSKLGAYVMGAFAAMKGKSSQIVPLNIDMHNYDTIIISTPVWASSPVPAVNAFLEKTDFKGKQVILLISPASGDDSKAAALLTEKIHSKGGKVLHHHAFKTSGNMEDDLKKQAVEIAKLYK
jgi:flavodoxin